MVAGYAVGTLVVTGLVPNTTFTRQCGTTQGTDPCLSGSEMTLIALIDENAVIEKILGYLDLCLENSCRSTHHLNRSYRTMYMNLTWLIENTSTRQ